MFTGLIEDVGVVVAVERGAAGARLQVRTGLAPSLAPGDSLAVNGVCLTAISRDAQAFHADVGPETIRLTTLGGLEPGRAVNLERPMRGDGRFGGHFVQGHVDGTGELVSVRSDGDARWLVITFPPELASYLVAKGSVAVDGTSLTVAALHRDRFEVMIIPFTWAHTALSSVPVGARVNLECDMIGKYVARALELSGQAGPR